MALKRAPATLIPVIFSDFSTGSFMYKTLTLLLPSVTKLPSNSTQNFSGQTRTTAPGFGKLDESWAWAFADGAVTNAIAKIAKLAIDFLMFGGYSPYAFGFVVTDGAGPNSVSSVAAFVDPSVISHLRYSGFFAPSAVVVKHV